MKPIVKILIVVFFTLPTHSLHATTYILVASGNYSASSTWMGGNVPPVNLGADTLILAPSLTTYSLALDVDLSLSALSRIDLVNTLVQESGKRYISMPAGSIVCSLSRIEVDSMYIGNGASFMFRGTINVNAMMLDRANFNAGPHSAFAVKKNLYITGGPSWVGNIFYYAPPVGSSPVNMRFINGGGLSVPAGVQFELGGYNLYYGCDNTATGPDVYNEQGGKGLKRIEVDTKWQVDVKLKADVLTDPVLVLTSGGLVMDGHDFRGTLEDKGGEGVIVAHPDSHLTLSSASTGKWDTLHFRQPQSKLSHFAAGQLVVNGDVSTDTLTLLYYGPLAIKHGVLNITGKGPVLGSTYIVTDTGGRVTVRADSGKAFIPVGTYRSYMPAKISKIPGNTCTIYTTLGVRFGGHTGQFVAYKDYGPESTWTITNPYTNIDVELGWDTSGTHLAFDYKNCVLTRFIGPEWEKHVPAVPSTSAGNGIAFVKRENVPAGMYAIVNPHAFYSLDNVQAPESAINIYPNPASGFLQVVSQHRSATAATVYDAMGRGVLAFQLAAGNNKLDITSLPAGVYSLVVTTEHTRGSYRFSAL